MNIRLFIAIQLFRSISTHIVSLQQKFLIGVSAAFFFGCQSAEKNWARLRARDEVLPIYVIA